LLGFFGIDPDGKAPTSSHQKNKSLMGCGSSAPKKSGSSSFVPPDSAGPIDPELSRLCSTPDQDPTSRLAALTPAQINGVDKLGRTALALACVHGNALAVTALVRTGHADPAVYDQDTLCALDHALARIPGFGVATITELTGEMARRGAPVRAATGLRAALAGSVDVVKHVMTVTEVQPMGLARSAVQGGFVEVLGYLMEERGVAPTLELAFLAARHERSEGCLRALIGKDAALATSVQPPQGLSLLHAALAERNAAGAVYLAGVDGVEAIATASTGNTGFMAACVLSRDEAVLGACLAAAKAQGTTKHANAHGLTALHLAVHHLNDIAASLMSRALPQPDMRELALVRDKAGKIPLEHLEEKASGQFLQARDDLRGLVRFYEVQNWGEAVCNLWIAGVPGGEAAAGHTGASLLTLDPKTAFPKHPDLTKKLRSLKAVYALAGLLDPLTRAVISHQVEEDWNVVEVSLWLEEHAKLPGALPLARQYSITGKDLLHLRTENYGQRLGLRTPSEIDAFKKILLLGRAFKEGETKNNVKFDLNS
jgi:hypothetical protein